MSDNVEKVRAFIAIHPPAEVIKQLTDLTTELKSVLRGDAFRWVKVNQLHLTLQFLGYISRGDVEAYQNAIVEAVTSNRSITLQAASLGCFPTVARARVLWVGLTGDGHALQKLKSDLDNALVPLGYKPEERPFHPHLTLARIVGPVPNRAEFKRTIEKYTSYTSAAFRVEKIHLMQSLLSPKGASYQSLASFSLQSD